MISAILLAAGESRRMGQNKLLLPWQGKTVIEHTLDALRQARLDEIVVVVGHEVERLTSILARYPVRWVENKQYAEGMSTSLKAGLRAVHEKATAVLIALADQPRIGAEAINRLIDAYERTGRKIIAPTFAGRRGNPVLIDLSFRGEMERLTGDVGCREILAAHPEAIALVPMDSDGALQDIDTPADYARAAGKPIK